MKKVEIGKMPGSRNRGLGLSLWLIPGHLAPADLLNGTASSCMRSLLLTDHLRLLAGHGHEHLRC